MLAGVATVIVGHPFDTVKVKGLYCGTTSSFVGMTFQSSLGFGIYSQKKQLMQGNLHSEKPQLAAIVLSGAFAGAIISFILCPSELVKCRMQFQGTDTEPLALVDMVVLLIVPLKLLKLKGFEAYSKGGATLLRESIGNAIFFRT